MEDSVNLRYFHVAPHVGAWIEIYHLTEVEAKYAVAPHVGAWIEIKHK